MSKILINALQYSNQGTGISTCCKKISEHMLNAYDDVDVLMREGLDLGTLNKNNINKIILKDDKSSTRIVAEQLKALNLYKKYEIIHSLDYATPVLYKGKKIATIHDMAMHTMKDKFTKAQTFTKINLLNNTIKNADKLICISEFSARELLKYYPNLDERKIEVIYNGFEYHKINISSEDQKSVLKKFNIDKPYLLFVGALVPHKNIERIIEAYNILKQKGYDYKLVLCGKKGWLYDGIFNKVEELKLKNDVIFTDYVTDYELEAIYSNSSLFIFPSLYEGFGFPPIEAMARKVPVITSREGALPEIVGDAALLCNAYDVIDISNKIIHIINNDDLRSKLIKRGLERVKYFSWEKNISNTHNLYDSILKTK